MSLDSLQELLAEVNAYPDGTDLLITAFYTSAHHYRRSTICTPFPSEVLAPLPGTKDKDFASLQRALAALPAVQSLLGGEDVLRNLPPTTLALLQWLLLHPTRRRHFSQATIGEMLRELPQRDSSMRGWRLPGFAGHNTPAVVLRAHEGYAQAPFPRGTVAYHGTHLENLHSILHTGLQNLSGTRLQRTGANFGAGIYLSTNYDTAFSFCQPCISWPLSRFGSKLRALLVCEVDLDRVDHTPSQSLPSATATAATASSAASDAASLTHHRHSDKDLPDTYLLVQRADALRLLYVLIYCDAATAAVPAAAAAGAAGGRRRVNLCTLMVVIYAGFLLAKGLLAALRQHRF
ncbi:hypothetical protein Agub_g9542 [Astrephomene gubernaculifera]|uniref:PARP n=1 Tax=Astrephomene gubernaculifera TaxID=47775 RepID=A0AAD3DTD9_9CHLO|nr:hypothetical protein Agub_g9542 [Astrephomene gubernaculifera]